jgi:glycosyltransferase involved in cell wall biosynthesis
MWWRSASFLVSGLAGTRQRAAVSAITPVVFRLSRRELERLCPAALFSDARHACTAGVPGCRREGISYPMNDISVVIPTFNRPEMLRETLHLLAMQTVAPDEVLVIDNGTRPAALPDGTIFRFALRYFRICTEAGAAQARNFGAALAGGKYVAFLDDDDYWDPDYIERLSDILKIRENSPPAMIVARVDHIDEGGRHFFRFAGDAKGIEPCFYFNPGYMGSSITVERSSFLELGGFDISLKTSEDKELAMRYMANNRLIVYDAGLVVVNRVHENTLSSRIDHVEVARLLLEKYRAETGLRIRIKTMREAYKKSGEKRYLLHRLLLKIILALISFHSVYK